jgi:hypothetical protein
MVNRLLIGETYKRGGNLDFSVFKEKYAKLFQGKPIPSDELLT